MARITYAINGKHDPSGINDAKNGLLSLGSVAQNVQKIFNGFMALKAVQFVGNAAAETINAFQTQQAALATLSQAVANNANLSAGAFNRLKNVTSELQKNSIYGDDELQKQAAYLASLGLTEEGIKKTLSASMELASSGMMPLDAAVKNLAKTYGGMAGELGEKIPALRNLTAEQMKTGAAIDLVAKSFKGMTEVAVSTLEGKTKSVQNIIGDIKEKIGTIFGAGKIAVLDALKPVLEKIDAWLENNVPKIINFFMNLPAIGKIALEAVWGMIQKVFTIDFWITYLANVGQFAIQSFKSVVNVISAIIIAVGTTIWEPLKYGFEMVAYGINLLFTGLINAIIIGVEAAVNFLLGGVNKVIGAVNAVSKFLGQGDVLSEVKSLDIKLIADPTKPLLNTAAISDSWKNIGKTFVDEVKATARAYTTAVGEIGKEFGPVVEIAATKMGEILNKELPKAIQEGISPGAVTSGAGSTSSSVETSNYAPSMLGDMSFFGLLKDTLMPVIQQFGGLISSLASVQSILNPLQTIFKGVLQVVQPILDSILKPLTGILIIVGRVIGATMVPTLKALQPVIELITKAFVFLYNYAIRPLSNAIIWVISTIYNMVANLVNGIIGALNRIPFVNISWRMATMDYDSMKLQKIDEAAVTTAGDSSGAYSSSANGGSSASYTGSRDITVNVNIDRSAIADLRDVAILIRNEIKSAEALGY